ncbi:MAG: S8 family serine peptidase [Desulforegulaceae bacterium]|nr:S8 family serine peptidase [Desulforegulaceae bacterium]
MKKNYLFLIFLIFFYSCSNSGSSDKNNNSETEKYIKGIVKLSGNAFVDFDLKDSGQGLNNSSNRAQYITPDSTLSGYVDSSDKEDWFVFYSDKELSLSINSEQNFDALIGKDPLNLCSFDSFKFLGPGKYYIQVRAKNSSGNYFIKIKKTGKNRLSADFDFVPGEVIVKFKNDSKTILGRSTDVFDNLQLKKDYQSFSVYKIWGKKPLALSSKTDLKEETINFINQLNENPDIEYSEPNFIRKPNYIPNDYNYYNLWNLDLINAPDAWDISRGGEIVVAVLDTGIVQHEEIPASRLIKGYNFLDGDENTLDPGVAIEGIGYHGTHVAGIIGASMDNYKGGCGVSPEVFIMPVRIVDKEVTSENIANGIIFAAGLPNSSEKLPSKNADIINMSFGGEGYSKTEKNACDAAVEEGVILLSASGNEGKKIVYYPGGYSNVICVSAVDSKKEIASYSNYGSFVTLAAPGGDSLSIKGPVGPEPHDYAGMTGTSMATPHVSGVIALMKSINKNLDSEDIFNMISQGKMTDDLGEPVFDNKYGYGLIDAKKSVYALNDFTSYSSVKVLLKDSSNNIIRPLSLAKIAAGTFSYMFKVSASGSYIIEAGIDLNNDNKFNGIGEISKTIEVVYENSQVQAEIIDLSYP